MKKLLMITGCLIFSVTVFCQTSQEDIALFRRNVKVYLIQTASPASGAVYKVAMNASGMIPPVSTQQQTWTLEPPTRFFINRLFYYDNYSAPAFDILNPGVIALRENIFSALKANNGRAPFPMAFFIYNDLHMSESEIAAWQDIGVSFCPSNKIEPNILRINYRDRNSNGIVNNVAGSEEAIGSYYLLGQKFLGENTWYNLSTPLHNVGNFTQADAEVISGAPLQEYFQSLASANRNIPQSREARIVREIQNEPTLKAFVGIGEEVLFGTINAAVEEAHLNLVGNIFVSAVINLTDRDAIYFCTDVQRALDIYTDSIIRRRGNLDKINYHDFLNSYCTFGTTSADMMRFHFTFKGHCIDCGRTGAHCAGHLRENDYGANTQRRQEWIVRRATFSEAYLSKLREKLILIETSYRASRGLSINDTNMQNELRSILFSYATYYSQRFNQMLYSQLNTQH